MNNEDISVSNPDYNEQDEINSFFQDCCSNNKLKEIKKLFKNKIKPSSISLGLGNACSANNLEIVKYLTNLKITLDSNEVNECFFIVEKVAFY